MTTRRDFLRRACTAAGGFHAFAALSSCQSPFGQEMVDPLGPWGSTNPWLSGNNAPVFEEVHAENLVVDGEIPTELQGTYLRNGPNPRFEPIAYRHPFDGDGMIHALHLENGRARYSNRWVRTAGWLEEDREGRALYGSLTGPGRAKNPASTSIVAHGGHILALYEGGRPYALTPELETLGTFDYHGLLERNMTAHPRVDPTTGELHFFRHGFGGPPFLVYYVADASGTITTRVELDIPEVSLIHDFVLTPRWVVFFDTPVKYRNGSFVWAGEGGTRVGLMDRLDPTAGARWIETDPLFLWHFIDARDDGDAVHVDYVRHGRPGFASGTGPGSPPHWWTLSIDTTSDTVTHRAQDARIVEYPTIDPRTAGLGGRYAYVAQVAGHPLPEYFGTLVQYDLLTSGARVHSFGGGRFTGEPIVAYGGTGTTGWVLSYVFDEQTATSTLQILDPENFAGAPVAVIHLPQRVPNGLHGHWMSR